MKIYETENKNSKLITALVNVWEKSVKATHKFLSDKEIKEIKKYVPKALFDAKHLIIAENELNEIIGFAGTKSNRLEMLFISPCEIGKGIGKSLLQYTIKNYNVSEVTVNEQNPQAVGFYEHMGFKIYKRTPLDEQGNEYPLLYMKL